MRRITFIAAACAAIAVGVAVPAAAEQPADHGYYFSGNAQNCEDDEFLADIQGITTEDLGETLIHADPGEVAANEIVSGDVHGDDNQYLDVTLLDDSYVITAVVVKGGPAYTLYLEEPWTGLHSPPLEQSGNIPAISHWFVCGYQETSTETPTPTPSETPSESPSETPSESPSETPSESPSESPSGTPSESPSGTPSESPTLSPTSTPSETPNGELPDTGSSPAVLLAVAGVLVFAGLLALRHRFVKP